MEINNDFSLRLGGLVSKDLILQWVQMLTLRIDVTLARLAICKTLSMIGDLYGIAWSIASIIVWDCCKAINNQFLL